jgi:hypothetical protein
MDCPLRHPAVNPLPHWRPVKTYMGCRMERTPEGTVNIWEPIRTGKPGRWRLIHTSSSMKSAHNYVHNTHARKD